MLRDDVRELRRVVDQALRNGEECWPVLPDGVGSGDSETFRLIEGTVNEASGVTAGATFNIDNVRPLAGGVNPAASTADGVNVEIELATGNYTDNQTPIRAIRDDDNARWIDVTDQSGDSTPQTYNVKLQAALTKAATSVSVKWLDASLVEVGSAFTAYDPHAQFSSGYGITDALGRVAKVTDADTGAERWELTHVEGLALFAKGTIDEDEGATTSGAASDTSPTTWGPKWQETTPPGTINVVGLDGELSGDSYKAVLKDPDANPPEYEIFEKAPEQSITRLAKIEADVPARSGATYGALTPVALGYLVSGVWTADTNYPGETIYNGSPSKIDYAATTLYVEVTLVAGSWVIAGPTQLQTLTGFINGTADQIITNVDGAVEWEDTGACS